MNSSESFHRPIEYGKRGDDHHLDIKVVVIVHTFVVLPFDLNITEVKDLNMNVCNYNTQVQATGVIFHLYNDRS